MSHPLLAGYPVVIEQAVSWGDMDAFQHVSNLVYFRYFQDARIEYFRRLHWMPDEVGYGVGPIVHSTQCRFRRAVTYPDRVWIGARAVDLRDDRFTVEHALVSERLGETAAEGWAVIVTYDYRKQQKGKMPDELRQRIAALEGK